MAKYSKSETGCCPRFNPKPWSNKILKWKNKKFVVGKVFCLFYMPMNFGQVISKLFAEVQKQKAESKEHMGLSDHTSLFNMNIYVPVSKEVRGLKNVSLSGKFLTRVYEGPFKETGKWCKEYAEYAKGRGLKISKMYMWYTTCPKCAEHYGKNYVVIVGKIQ